MPYLEVKANADLRALGKAIQQAGAKDLKLELVKAGHRVTKPIKEDVKRSAVETLPRRGGFGTWVAALDVKTQVRTMGRNVGVRIVGAMNNKAKASHRRGIEARKKGRAC